MNRDNYSVWVQGVHRDDVIIELERRGDWVRDAQGWSSARYLEDV